MATSPDHTLLARRIAVVRAAIAAAEEDLAGCLELAAPGEAHELMTAVRGAVLAALYEVLENVEVERTVPDLPLRLAITDEAVRWPADLHGRYRVGFLATTGDPVHWGHLLIALRAIPELDLDTVVLQVMGDHPHKRDRKQPKEHRHAIGRLAAEYFYPLIRYTPLGFDNLKIGEENTAELLLLNCDLPIDVFFIGGDDVTDVAISNLAACRTLLSVLEVDGTRIPELYGTFFVRDRPHQEIGELEAEHPFVRLVARRHEPLPRVGGRAISSTLFRGDPTIPLLPSKCLWYVRRHGLYGSVQERQDRGDSLAEHVIIAYLPPDAFAVFEAAFGEVVEVGPLVEHGPVVKNAKLGTTTVSYLRGFGRESTILPVVRQRGVRNVFAVGLCGAVQTSLRRGDVIVPTVAIRGESITDYWEDPRMPAVPDPVLSDRLRRGLPTATSGLMYTTSSLARERQVVEQTAARGVLGVEMELAQHLTLCRLHGKASAAAYVVSDNVALWDSILDEGIHVSAEIRSSLAVVASALEQTVRDDGA